MVFCVRDWVANEARGGFVAFDLLLGGFAAADADAVVVVVLVLAGVFEAERVDLALNARKKENTY